MQPAREGGEERGRAQATAASRERDLSAVEVSGQDQLEAEAHRLRKGVRPVDQEERRSAGGAGVSEGLERPEAATACPVVPRIVHSGDQERGALAPRSEHLPLAPKQPQAGSVRAERRSDPLGADLHVVIAQHGVDAERSPQAGEGSRTGRQQVRGAVEEIAREDHQVGGLRVRHAHQLPHAFRRHAVSDVEIAQVRQAHTPGQAGQGDAQLRLANPPRARCVAAGEHQRERAAREKARGEGTRALRLRERRQRSLQPERSGPHGREQPGGEAEIPVQAGDPPEPSRGACPARRQREGHSLDGGEADDQGADERRLERTPHCGDQPRAGEAHDGARTRPGHGLEALEDHVAKPGLHGDLLNASDPLSTEGRGRIPDATTSAVGGGAALRLWTLRRCVKFAVPMPARAPDPVVQRRRQPSDTVLRRDPCPSFPPSGARQS